MKGNTRFGGSIEGGKSTETMYERQSNNRRPSTREWEGKTRERNHYRVVLTNGNGVTQDQRRYAQGKRSQVNRVPKDTARGCIIRIATLNIWSGRAGGLETDLFSLRKGNIGIGVLQETKLARGIHT